jgi:type IV secretory pathway VirB3-like protein
VDLSAIIFVVLALAWAVYLIPKALKHHDEMASDRLVEGHSDKVRILARKRRTVVTDTVETLEPAVEVSAPIEAGLAPSRPTRAAARKAAQRRRRVLGVLVLALVVVWTLTWFAYLPFMTPAIPAALVVAWLVVARLSVRQQHRRTTTVVAPSMVDRAPVEAEPAYSAPRASSVASSPSMVDRLADEVLTDSSRQEVEAVLADDGSLWDPLPMTLPTYVNKARARRTVRTIELTGINSSGHDEADTALAREASEAAEQSERGTAEAEAEQRRVAGA